MNKAKNILTYWPEIMARLMVTRPGLAFLLQDRTPQIDRKGRLCIMVSSGRVRDEIQKYIEHLNMAVKAIVPEGAPDVHVAIKRRSFVSR